MTPLQRYLAYLDKLPPAISRSGGHDATFQAACEGFRFGLSAAEVGEGLRAYNMRCQPPWAEKELDHKVADAEEVVRARGEYGRRVGFTGKPKQSRKNSEAAGLRIARKHAARLAVNREITANRQVTGYPADSPSLPGDVYGPPPLPGVPIVNQSREIESAWWARELAAMGLPDPAATPLADFRRAVAARTGNSGNDGNAPDSDYWQFILAGEGEALAFTVAE